MTLYHLEQHAPPAWVPLWLTPFVLLLEGTQERFNGWQRRVVRGLTLALCGIALLVWGVMLLGLTYVIVNEGTELIQGVAQLLFG